MHELGLADETVFTYNSSPAAVNRYLYYPDHLVRLPMPQLGIFNMFKTLATEPAFEGIFSAIAFEFWRAPRNEDVQDESIGDFFARRFNHKMVERVLSAVIHGIYAGDVYQLSARSLFPTPFRYEGDEGCVTIGLARGMSEGSEVSRRDLAFLQSMKALPLPQELARTFKKSNVFTFRQGLNQLVDSIADKLRTNGNVKFSTNTSVERVISNKADNIDVISKSSSATESEASPTTASHSHAISCLAPAHLAKVVASERPNALSTTLSSIPAVTVMTVNLYYKTPYLHPPGFGYLIPLATPMEQNPERALGVVFDTSYSPGPEGADPHMSGPHQDHVTSRGTKLTVMLGGHYWDGWPVHPSKEEGLQMAQSLLERHLGITEKPAAHMVNLQLDCIPQYTVGHEDRLRSIHLGLLGEYKGKMRVAGNWSRGVGVNDCLRSAWDVVQELRDEDRTGLEAVVEEKHFARVKPAK